MRGKENADSNIRSPVRTRSYTAKHKITIDEKKNGLTTPKRTIKSKVVAQPKKTAEKKAEKASASRSSIDVLNTDSLELIFQFVGVYDTMTNVRAVCKHWNTLAQKVPYPSIPD